MNSSMEMRIIWLSCGLMVALSTVWCYTAYLQIFQHEFLSLQGMRQYAQIQKTVPPRGTIYDRHGATLATNATRYAACISPATCSDRDTLASYLQTKHPSLRAPFQAAPHRQFMYLVRNLSCKERDEMAGSAPDDVFFLPEQRRYYPVPSLGHTIGITDSDNRGISGIEWQYESYLRGDNTPELYDADTNSSNDLSTTLDSTLQFHTHRLLQEHVEQLEAREGYAIITKPGSGDILAMAVYPDFDPNQPIDHEKLPHTTNKIFCHAYEFGSVIKIFPALAALDAGVVTADTRIDCENTRRTRVNGIPISTWKACGDLSYAEVIRLSNNIGTAKVALSLGTPLYDALRTYGFGSKTSIGFPGEQSGYITPPSLWSKATPCSLSFGYELRATCAQLAQAWSIVACNGTCVPLRLFQEHSSSAQSVTRTETALTLRAIISFEHATNMAHFGKIPGCHIMGKTGTALMLGENGYDQNKKLYTFAAVLEKGSYQRVIVVCVREPKEYGKKRYAATVAVPLFKKIAQAMLCCEGIVTQDRIDDN